MRAATSPFAAPTASTNSDGPESPHRSFDEPDARDEDDAPDDEATVRAWADDIAERVVALWVGRAEVTPIASALIEAGQRSRGHHRRS